MSRWPLFLRLAAAGAALAFTIWAFAHGMMVLAILGVAASAFVVQRAFLSDV